MAHSLAGTEPGKQRGGLNSLRPTVDPASPPAYHEGRSVVRAESHLKAKREDSKRSKSVHERVRDGESLTNLRPAEHHLPRRAKKGQVHLAD